MSDSMNMVRVADAQLDKLLALEEKATQGHWIAIPRGSPQWMVGPDPPGNCVVITSQKDDEENSTFIAATRNSLKSLVTELRERRAADAAVTKMLAGFTDEDIAELEEEQRKEGTECLNRNDQ